MVGFLFGRELSGGKLGERGRHWGGCTAPREASRGLSSVVPSRLALGGGGVHREPCGVGMIVLSGAGLPRLLPGASLLLGSQRKNHFVKAVRSRPSAAGAC